MWTINRIPKQCSILWLLIMNVAMALTGLQMSMSPASRGGEIFQTFGLAIILYICGLIAVMFQSNATLNAVLFAALFWCGDVSLWFKVARVYRYAPFAEQFWATFFLAAVFFGLLLASGRRIQRLRHLQAAA
jgi:hypothetical protein